MFGSVGASLLGVDKGHPKNGGRLGRSGGKVVSVVRPNQTSERKHACTDTSIEEGSEELTNRDVANAQGTTLDLFFSRREGVMSPPVLSR